MVKKAKQIRPGRASDQFIVRFPGGMRNEIAQQAQENGRSMNAEIVARLDASFQSFLSQEGLVAVSRRLEGAAAAFEQLYFDVRDRRVADHPEQMSSHTNWKGFLRLSFVTCPVAIYAAASDASPLPFKKSYTIEIDQFIPRAELDPIYIRDSYYLVTDGKIGHDAFAVIRESIRTMNKVALAWIEVANRRHIIALEARNAGLFAMLLRHPSEVRDPAQYFEGVQDVHVTKDMLDLAKHIVENKSSHFEPDKFGAYCINASESADRSIDPPSNVINLMDALRKSAA
jgi:non-homologous end joining protein Ku